MPPPIRISPGGIISSDMLQLAAVGMRCCGSAGEWAHPLEQGFS